jgi:hypothetical protein
MAIRQSPTAPNAEDGDARITWPAVLLFVVLATVLNPWVWALVLFDLYCGGVPMG